MCINPVIGAPVDEGWFQQLDPQAFAARDTAALVIVSPESKFRGCLFFDIPLESLGWHIEYAPILKRAPEF